MSAYTRRIAIVNRATDVTDREAMSVVAALQTQVSRDFEPIWGIGTVLGYVAQGEEPPPGMWQVVLVDNLSVAGALGFHDLTADALPLGKVGVETAVQDNEPWSVTASHELLEMLGDPGINQLVMHGGKLWSFENCDACERSRQGYLIDGVAVSDFVFPDWFLEQPSTGKLDLCGHIDRPFGLLPGGYALVYGDTGWTQVFHDGAPNYLRLPQLGSRRERRIRGKGAWLRSAPARVRTAP